MDAQPQKTWIVICGIPIVMGCAMMGGRAKAWAVQASPTTTSHSIAQLTPDRLPFSPQPDIPRFRPLPNQLPTVPTPSLPAVPSPNLPQAPTPAAVTVRVRQVQVLGSTVFSQAQLAEAVRSFIGQELTFEQLLELRTVITRLYASKGYTTSGAFLPPQDVTQGVITVQVVEGQVERVEVKGLTRLRSRYVRDRILLAAQVPLNIRRLESALQLLQLNPLLTSVQAELKAGSAPGRSVLSLTLKESKAFDLTLGLENRDSPSVGSIRASLGTSHSNLTGNGDRLSLDVGITSGVRDYDVAYAFPLNARDGTLTLRYSNTTSQIVERPFDVLDIRSEGETLSLGFRQPLWRSPTTEFALGLTGDFRRSQTSLLGIPFSFSTGPERGLSQVTVLRFSQDWIHRSPRRVLAARSQFSLGLDALGATVNDSGTDGRFFSWVGQLQWVQAFHQRVLTIARLSTQLTGDSLLPLEQFSIGGADTVRGYRQNQRVGDAGINGSLEMRITMVQDPDGVGVIQAVPFFDIGSVWNKTGTPETNTLMSAGLGLRWQRDPYLSFRVDWGIPLISVENRQNSLQDSGLFFSVQLRLPLI